MPVAGDVSPRFLAVRAVTLPNTAPSAGKASASNLAIRSQLTSGRSKYHNGTRHRGPRAELPMDQRVSGDGTERRLSDGIHAAGRALARARRRELWRLVQRLEQDRITLINVVQETHPSVSFQTGGQV